MLKMGFVGCKKAQGGGGLTALQWLVIILIVLLIVLFMVFGNYDKLSDMIGRLPSIFRGG